MTTPRLIDDIDAAESCVLRAYPDPLSPAGVEISHGRSGLGRSGDPWTIGWGHTGPEVHQGLIWTQAQADAARDLDIKHACDALDRAFPWWRQMSDPRQDVLANMTFNMGIVRLSKFVNTLEAMRLGDYEAAAAGMLASLWARQVGNRAKRLAQQMRTGQHP